MFRTGSTQGQAPAVPQPLQVVAPVIVKPLKVNLLEPFDGSWGKLQTFFSQVELFFGFNADRFVNEKYKVLFDGLYLRRPAFEWLNTFLQDFLNNDPKNKDDVTNIIMQKFSRFKERMRQVFRNFDKKHTAERENKFYGKPAHPQNMSPSFNNTQRKPNGRKLF